MTEEFTRMASFTNQEILKTALRQSAIDANCTWDCFLRQENVVVLSRAHPEARKYLELPLDCNLISYGNNIVASVSEDLRETVSGYISRFPVARCFETPHLHVLNQALERKGLRICFMAEYFLPDVERLRALDCPLPVRVLHQEDFASFYTDMWSNALCGKRRELDVLGVGAYDGGELVGLAACSADCGGMWQIGVDVHPAYRRQGIASALISQLALHILERGKVPFYCAAWSNLPSVRSAGASGFRPTWVEMTAKSISYVEEMNGCAEIQAVKEYDG